MKKNFAGILIFVIALSMGIGFFVGIKYSDYKRLQDRGISNRQFPGGTNGATQGQGRMTGRPVTGEIISINDSSITVKLPDGGSRIIILSEKTIYTKTTEASKADLSVGMNIGVFGTENSDKSMTAQNIQLNPQFRMSSGSAQPLPTK